MSGVAAVAVESNDEAGAPSVESVATEPSELAQLVLQASGGDQDAWNALVDRFAGIVWAIARAHRLDEATAADVSQTTWLRLVEHLDRIEQPERIGAWLATTARRESLRVLRAASRLVPTGEEFDLIVTPSGHSLDVRMLAEERDRLLADLVRQLPCRCQSILALLNAEEPLSYKKLSEVLAMPVGSIGPTRARCLEHLRRIAERAGVALGDAIA